MIQDPDLEGPPSAPGSNAEPYSVSELAFALKRTLESQYDQVRLRGEVSKITRHSSGHVYLTLKDDKAAIDGVVWKGQVSRLKAQPETGMDVVVTGKITTFPASSKYQIVIETLEMAGVGALLAQFERLKTKLAGEGLFEVSRKKPLPFAPRTIGVITSPTGAVIRDILHRIRDRWPCRVLVWPVVVQGDGAAAQVIAAIKGFQVPHPDLPRPDILIVARGGGSVEDLWAFNDEALARCVFECRIPIISAIGHETDTTLIDFVSDRRAPTPTGAAEMATPVLGELKALLSDLSSRLIRAQSRLMSARSDRLTLVARALPRPQDLLGAVTQSFDFVAHRLNGALTKAVTAHVARFDRVEGRFHPRLLNRPLDIKRSLLTGLALRLMPAIERDLQRKSVQARLDQLQSRAETALSSRLKRLTESVNRLDQLRLSLDPDRPLALGFARVSRPDASLVTQGAQIKPHETLYLRFKDAIDIPVLAQPESIEASKPVKPEKLKSAAPSVSQGSLFDIE